MALVGLVRLTTVARLCGANKDTTERWCRRLGIDIIRAPVTTEYYGRVRGEGRTSPRYLGINSAMLLVDKLLHASVDRILAKQINAKLRAESRELEDSTKGISHAELGTTVVEPEPTPCVHGRMCCALCKWLDGRDATGGGTGSVTPPSTPPP